MLSQLTITNFGLIDKISVDFCSRLNVLTGETGAGKSIIIDALRFCLGERLNSSQIRDTDKPCVVEAVFELQYQQFSKFENFAEFLTPEEPILIINRNSTADGRSRVKINGATVTVSQLKDIGRSLIDFHGPHDHQMLLSEDCHMDILDRLTDFKETKAEYAKLFTDYSLVKRKITELESLSTGKERELDLLQHQVTELQQVSLEEGDYDKLKQEQVKINNAERLYEAANQILQLLDSEEGGLSENIRKAFSPLLMINKIDESTEPLAGQLNQIQESADNFLAALKDYLDSLSFDPEYASQVNLKYDSYDNILRKYGPTLADAKTFYEAAKERHSLLADLEHNDADLRAQLKDLESQLKAAAKKISQAREKTSKQLKVTIENELTELGIRHVQFESRVKSTELNENGQDQVVFYISPNAGESLKPLAEIVSSGEAARVMLALKKALMKVDPIPVLIFDEVDAQIGGRLGTIIGNKLREISRNRQVLLITHLPQIASFADQHYMVLKAVESGRAVTKLAALNKETQIEELAHMLSGEKKDQISRKHAQEMLAKARG